MVDALEHAVLRTLAPLDAARAFLLRVFGRSGRSLLRDPQSRVAFAGVLGVSTTFTLTMLCPLLLLSLGPLALGVPHLVADVRYVVVRQQVHRRRSFWLCSVPCLALCAIYPRLYFGTGAIAVAALCARSSLAPRLAVACASVGVALAARAFGTGAEVLFAHAHNLVALAFWVLWARGDRRQVVFVLVLYALAASLIFGGVVERVLYDYGTLASSRWALDAGSLVETLSPVRDPRWALRWLLFFAFSQSLHYAIWLRFVPDETRERAGIRSFAASYRALCRDLGRPLICFSILALVVLCFCALFGVARARDGYLRLSLFHGPLEVAVGVQLLLERRRLAVASPC